MRRDLWRPFRRLILQPWPVIAHWVAVAALAVALLAIAAIAGIVLLTR